MSSAYDSPPPDNAVSIDWNGHVFVLTVRNGATAPPIAYGTSPNGIDWTYTSPSALGASTGAAAADLYHVQWLGGRHFVVCGNVAVTATTTSSAAAAQLPAIFQLQGPEYTPVARYLQPTAGASVPQTVYAVADALEHPHRIVFPASTLLALGNNGARIAVSGDEGATWTASFNGAAVFSVAAHAAAWNGRVFVAVGDDSNGTTHAPGNVVASSLDGRHWTTRGGRHLFRSAYAVQWCKERNHFLALGDDPTGTVSVVATSMDGVHWRQVHRGLFAAAGNGRMDLAWNGELWVATGSPRPNLAGSKSLAFSADGESWSYIAGEDPFASTGGGGGSRVFYLADDRQWVALDASAALVSLSMNGRQWQQAQPVANAAWVASPSFELPFPLLSDPSWIAQPTRYVFNDCTHGRATIQPLSLAGGEGTTGTAVAYSVDGTVWSPAAAPCPLLTCNRICWNGQLWVGVGTPCVAASLDGIRWFAVSSTDLFTETYDVAWNGQWFVAVGYKLDVSSIAQPQIARSRDGLEWTTAVSAGVASIFAATDRVAAIEWTGQAWVAYGSQSFSAVSTDADASTWTRKHYYLLDASNVAQPALGAVATASSINSDNSTVLGAAIVMDGSDSTFWESDYNTYGPSGEYIGNQQTAYVLPGGDPAPLTVSGEWLQIDLSAAAVVSHYCISISDNDWPSVPKTWVLLASANRGNTWTYMDSFALSISLSVPPNAPVGPSTPYTVWALDVSNAAAYHSFRLVFPTSMGPQHDTVKLSEWKLIVENSGVVVDAPYRIRPLVLKDYVLHPIRLQNDTRNICSVTDLCGNFVRDGVVYGQYYVDAVVHGLAQGAACAHTYDGYYHVAASTAGELTFLTNGSSLSNLRWNPLLEGIAPVCPLTSIRSACFNTRFVLLAGDNGGGVVYGAFGADKQYPAEFYPTNAASVVGGNVRCVASNSGFGHVVPHNTLYIERGEHLAVTTPAYYADSSTEKTQISFVAQPM